MSILFSIEVFYISLDQILTRFLFQSVEDEYADKDWSLQVRQKNSIRELIIIY